MAEEGKNSSNLHKNHRQRLKARFLAEPNSLSKHELMELLLFYCIPQKNVNEQAHALIDTYSTIGAVLRADGESLKKIDGIGDSAACFLTLIGKLADVMETEKHNALKMYSLESVKPFLINLYKNSDTEVFTAFYLSKTEKIISRQTFTSNLRGEVSVAVAELSRSISLANPNAVVIAHNHLSGNPNPSFNDDRTTEKLYLLFQLNGVRFYDHIIISGEKVFSYKHEGRLDDIKNNIEEKLS